MKISKRLILIGFISLGLQNALGKSGRKGEQRFDKELERTLSSYRRGEFSALQTWNALVNLEAKKQSKSRTSISRIRAVQAQLLKYEKYTILSSLYASESIKISDELNTA